MRTDVMLVVYDRGRAVTEAWGVKNVVKAA